MFVVRKIDSLDLPALQPYRTMRRQHAHKLEGIFISEGDKVLHRLLQSRFQVISALMPEEDLETFRADLESRTETVDVYLADKRLLEILTGFKFYQGILALAKIPRMPTLHEILRIVRRPLLLAAMDGLASAENVGALTRSCAALAAAALVFDGTSSSPYLRRAVRSSMGTVFELPIVEVADLTDALVALRAAGVQCVAAHPHAEGARLWDVDLREDTCLIFGSEGHGISPRVLRVCDRMAAIPMHCGVDSLNVASAAAAFLAETQRQRST